MRTHLLLLSLVGTFAATTSAQVIVGFSDQSVISTEMDRAQSVYSTDLDGDGDLDVLSSSSGDGRIAWYENLGGTFGPQQLIVQADGNGHLVRSGDLDGDGDLDVLWSAGGLDGSRVVWHPNLGAGAFGPGIDLTVTSESPRALSTADLDGDGDLEVLSSFLGDDFENGQHAFWENLGGGLFGPQVAIAEDVGLGINGSVRDMDGDGDPDFLAVNGLPFLDEFVLYRNNGGLSFSEGFIVPQPADDFRVAESIEGFDLDGDGDRDLLTTLSLPNGVYWQESLGDGSFGPRQLISEGVAGSHRALASDLDLDGDLDVVAGGFASFDRLAWFENQGGAVFGPLLAIVPENEIQLQGLSDIAIADLDDDGDPDVLSSSVFDDKIAWYGNWTASSVEFGAGCGAPAMDFVPTSPAVLGQTFGGRIEGARELNFVHVGFSKESSSLGALPLDLAPLGAPGCFLYASDDLVGLPTIPTASPDVAEWTATLPLLPALEGAHLFVQAIGLSFSDPAMPIATSNGIDWQVAD